MSAELHYTDTGGSGEAVVLVHAIGCDSHMWDALEAALAPAHRIVRVDLRGHGASPVVAGPCSLEDLAGDVADVLHRLRAEVPDRTLIVLWDGAPYHRANAVREAASALGIKLVPLPGYSPDLMPVEALWRWLREDVTYHHCHTSPDDLTRRAAAFEARINKDPCALADRLWVKDQLDLDEEKLRFPK